MYNVHTLHKQYFTSHNSIHESIIYLFCSQKYIKISNTNPFSFFFQFVLAQCKLNKEKQKEKTHEDCIYLYANVFVDMCAVCNI